MRARQLAATSLPPWTRRSLVIATRAAPRVAAELRVHAGLPGGLPDYLVIGAQRCGTTYLHALLTAHPDVVAPLTKEVEFFDRNWHRGVPWYRSHFPQGRAHGQDLPAAITGEASPSYLFHPDAPQRVREILPAPRLIVLLRNPVDRAYSHYLHAVRLGFERRLFEDAIAHEEHHCDFGTQRRSDDQFSQTRHYSYLARGRYVDQLDDWTAYFPGHCLLILRSEDFYADVRGILREVTDHIGVSPWQPDALPSPKTFRHPPMCQSTRDRLLAHFRPHNERLQEGLGRDMCWDT